MKKGITILVMLLIAATAYNQTSRRPANKANTANRSNREASVERKSSTTTSGRTYSKDAVVKTKRTNKTYHHDPKSAGNRSTTYTHTSVNTERNKSQHTPVVRNTQTQSTSPAGKSRSTTYKNTTGSRVEIRNTDHYTSGSNRSKTTSRSPVQHHREYNSPRVYRERHTVVHHYHHTPAPKVYRARHYAYRRPPEINIIWTPVMHRHYIRMYPMVKYWYYTNGYRIMTVSAYDAEYYRGEVRTVYGRVTEVFYSRTTDEYFLYFGLYYPYQDFTVVIPGYIARRYSHRPDRYFEDRHLAVTGLITTFNGEPEIVVKESFQINLY